MKNKFGLIISTLIILIFIVFRIILNTDNKEVVKAGKDDSNLQLALSNQSQKSIKLNVYVDGNLCVEYDSDGGDSHHINFYYYKVTSGFHTIKAVSNDGISVKKLIITGRERKWVIVQYWNDRDAGEKIIIVGSDNKPLIY